MIFFFIKTHRNIKINYLHCCQEYAFFMNLVWKQEEDQRWIDLEEQNCKKKKSQWRIIFQSYMRKKATRLLTSAYLKALMDGFLSRWNEDGISPASVVSRLKKKVNKATEILSKTKLTAFVVTSDIPLDLRFPVLFENARRFVKEIVLWEKILTTIGSKFLFPSIVWA